MLSRNSKQDEFCFSKDKHIRLLAPAGCGKSISILWRCLELNRLNPSDKFLIFTFTRAAREELERKLNEGEFLAVKNQIKITTLNSYGKKHLQGVKKGLKLVSSDERHWKVLQNLQPVWRKYKFLDELLSSKFKFKIAQIVMDLIDSLKTYGFRHDFHSSKALFLDHLAFIKTNCAQTEEIIFKKERLRSFDEHGAFDSADRFYENFYKFWCEAVPLLFEQSIVTFEDQKYWALIDIHGKIKTASHQSKKNLTHIFVDEFQDINPLDLSFIKLTVCHLDATLSIVGDEDQAIYEWRGASPRFIINPEKFFSMPFKTIVLDRNYRSPSNIVRFANNLISHNEFRTPKNIVPNSNLTANVEVKTVSDINGTIDDVMSRIENIQKNNPKSTIAIIGRKRSQIIPHQITFSSKGKRFDADEDINIYISGAFETLCHLIGLHQKIRANLKTASSFEVIRDLEYLIDYIYKFPLNKTEKSKLNKLLSTGFQHKSGYLEGASILKDRGDFLIAKKTSINLYTIIMDFILADDVSSLLNVISNSFDGLKKDYEKSQDDFFYSDPPFAFMTDFSLKYGSDFERFLRDIEKAKFNLRNWDEESEDSRTEFPPIHLMTALRTKGREFDHVFVLDCNEGVWPISHAKTPELSNKVVTQHAKSRSIPAAMRFKIF